MNPQYVHVHTMDHPDFIVWIFMENSNSQKWIQNAIIVNMASVNYLFRKYVVTRCSVIYFSSRLIKATYVFIWQPHERKIFLSYTLFNETNFNNETKLTRNVIEKYYTWVDVQFLLFSQFPSLFNVSRDFILSFVSYNLILGNMFYRILVYLNCAMCTCT